MDNVRHNGLISHAMDSIIQRVNWDQPYTLQSKQSLLSRDKWQLNSRSSLALSFSRGYPHSWCSGSCYSQGQGESLVGANSFNRHYSLVLWCRVCNVSTLFGTRTGWGSLAGTETCQKTLLPTPLVLGMHSQSHCLDFKIVQWQCISFQQKLHAITYNSFIAHNLTETSLMFVIKTQKDHHNTLSWHIYTTLGFYFITYSNAVSCSHWLPAEWSF